MLEGSAAAPLGTVSVPVALAGMLTAALSGFAAISLLMRLIKKQKLRLFSVYCFIVGGIAITVSFVA
jgi:undecaprenyl-diphosphatase